MQKITKNFKVVAVSENTNSFGLKQMIMIAKDGTAYTGCFNYLNVKKQHETIVGIVQLNDEGEEIHTEFRGGELITKQDNAPKEVIERYF